MSSNRLPDVYHGSDLSSTCSGNNSYVLVTAAKNEERYILKTLQSVVDQTQLPKAWVIVSDGSTDRTDEYVRDFADRYDFIQLLRLENAGERAFSSKSLALNAGYDKIRHIESGFVGFLDADISLPPNYYEALSAKFDMHSRLGLAGGVSVENCGGGWKVRYGESLINVAGQMQLFRRKCYEDIGDFVPLRWGGEDTFANVIARRKGWEVCVFPELRVCHHRRTGTAGVSVHGSRFRQGMMDYFLGYHPLFELGKCVRRILEPPYLTGSVLRLCGYLWPCLKRERPTVTADFIRYLRRQQMRRLFPAMLQDEKW